MGKKAVAGEKIADPAAHADRLGGGPYVLWRERDLWGDLAPHYTTLSRFGQAGGVSWYNNCGPTAVTNLLVMVRRRAGISGTLRGDQDLYARVARYGVRHLFYINARRGPFHGTSDLRAGTYLRRMFRRLAGVSPAITCRRATEANLRRSLDRGGLLYLVLRHHPAYRDHHLVGYGYTEVRSETTGAVRTYLKVSDGHAPAPRYLDLAACRTTLWFYYEVLPPRG